MEDMQIKTLHDISHELYELHYVDADLKQIKCRISYIQYSYSKQLSEKDQKNYLKIITNGKEWFTDRSPINDAIESGELHHYGGISKVKITRL
jgi:hypothetical protein